MRYPPVVDYRQFRFNKLNTETYRHLKLLLFWPLFLASYFLIDRGFNPDFYHSVHCFLDDWIPFCEWFLLPYVFWYVFQIGIVLYTLLYDIPVFRRYMHFVILTYSIANLIYLLYPTCQEMRPEVFPRNNLMTKIVSFLYWIDTNTNVCPSTHVIGAVGVALAAGQTERFSAGKWKLAFWGAALLIIASTLFLKQHSALDSIAAIPVCLLGYLLCFRHRVPNKTGGSYEGSD